MRVNLIKCFICAMFLFSALFMGCSKAPEQKFVDHLEDIVDILTSSDDCEDVADDLKSYIDKNEEKMTAILAEVLVRDSEDRKAEFEKASKKVKDKFDSVEDLKFSCKDDSKVEGQMTRIAGMFLVAAFKAMAAKEEK